MVILILFCIWIFTFLLWMTIGKTVYCLIFGGFNKFDFVNEWKSNHNALDYICYFCWPIILLFIIYSIISIFYEEIKNNINKNKLIKK